jgi:hypothetical protein
MIAATDPHAPPGARVVSAEPAVSAIESEMRATYSASKKCWRNVLLLWCIATAAAVMPLAPLPEPLQLTCTALTFLCTVLSFFARWRADTHHQTAEALRRTLLLADGLGEQSHPTELARLRVDAAAGVSSDPVPIGRYYTSHRARGWTRVLHNVQESAFYTEALARKTAHLCTAVVACGLLFALLIFLVAVNIPEPASTSRMIGNMVTAGVTSVIGSAFADLARAYFALARAASACLDRTRTLLDRSDLPERDVLSTVNTYDTALGNSPPIPGYMYRSMQARLDALWAHARDASESDGDT